MAFRMHGISPPDYRLLQEIFLFLSDKAIESQFQTDKRNIMGYMEPGSPEEFVRILIEYRRDNEIPDDFMMMCS
jgi:hypothetical protein